MEEREELCGIERSKENTGKSRVGGRPVQLEVYMELVCGKPLKSFFFDNRGCLGQLARTLTTEP